MTMTTEEYLWDNLCKARIGRKQVEALPPDTHMLRTIIALANQAVLEAAGSWSKHVTRP